MALREHLLAVADELRRLKQEGRRTVSIGEETLVALRRRVETAAQLEPALNEAPAAAAPAARPANPVSNSPSTPPAADVAVATRPAPASPTAPVAPTANLFATPPKAPAAKVALPSSGAAIPTPPVFTLPEGDKTTRWNWLRDFVVNHAVCQAHVRPGKKVVLGVGALDAKIFFCGEAPGADEEIKGEPFVGAAGQLLTRMIKAMGLERAQVYIGNIMNWRPEMPTASGVEQVGNRPPTAQEMAFCLPFLRAQLEIVQPEMIVALGATAAKGLLGEDSFTTIGSIRGQWKTFAGVPVMVTYHPSYLLRNNSNRAKRTVWEDLLQVMERGRMPISDRQRNYFLDS